jgi:hypothetical protein
MSIASTRCPFSAKATARLSVVVVLATPPFWLANAITWACGSVEAGFGAIGAGFMAGLSGVSAGGFAIVVEPCPAGG